jgi:signal transduction histidine kinase
MADPAIRKSGRTLGWLGKGSADLRRLAPGYTLRRAAITGVAIGAFVAGLAASSAALQGDADAGVVAELPGERISSVSPTGFAWRDGIRPGQLVVALTAADELGGWRLETIEGQRHHVSEAAPADAGLRASLPLGLAALVAGGLVLLLLRTRRQWVLPVAAVAFVAASTPLALHGDAVLSSIVLGAAGLVPARWAIGRLPGGRVKDLVLGVAVVAGLSLWAGARLGGWSGYAEIESARSVFSIWGTTLLIVDRAVLPRLAGGPIHMIRPSFIDVAAVALLTGGALALVNLFDVPPIVVAGLVVLAILARPMVRHRLRPIEDALLADVRAQAKAEGAEGERARLARELHDVPLQELIGVIRRLDVLPGAGAESDDLRALAGHLRNVAVELRPPVLDDLGLPAGLEYLAEQTTSEERPIVAVITAETTRDLARRPPTEVELAMFRIATEAVTNAIRHSGASAIEIWADVQPTRVELLVTDDGSGFDAGAARDTQGKHIGLSSMRRRAQAIDADLSIAAASPGTRVRALWQA